MRRGVTGVRTVFHGSKKKNSEYKIGIFPSIYYPLQTGEGGAFEALTNFERNSKFSDFS